MAGKELVPSIPLETMSSRELRRALRLALERLESAQREYDGAGFLKWFSSSYREDRDRETRAVHALRKELFQRSRYRELACDIDTLDREQLEIRLSDLEECHRILDTVADNATMAEERKKYEDLERKILEKIKQRRGNTSAVVPHASSQEELQRQVQEGRQAYLDAAARNSLLYEAMDEDEERVRRKLEERRQRWITIETEPSEEPQPGTSSDLQPLLVDDRVIRTRLNIDLQQWAGRMGPAIQKLLSFRSIMAPIRLYEAITEIRGCLQHGVLKQQADILLGRLKGKKKYSRKDLIQAAEFLAALANVNLAEFWKDQLAKRGLDYMIEEDEEELEQYLKELEETEAKKGHLEKRRPHDEL
ncbi:hypothetical protein KI387_006444 [Taxus chinensis]|uniref:Uncharacterized protein n=1 Tax=Taxus chinensis TaxID=29808 RepID=A0AA38GNW2_TAXCH|nr:hypothetical protein KI387_006444 [Taxus chinensis]